MAFRDGHKGAVRQQDLLITVIIDVLQSLRTSTLIPIVCRLHRPRGLHLSRDLGQSTSSSEEVEYGVRSHGCRVCLYVQSGLDN